ncbi:MAG: SRPBCC family protein [Betaproteobacteria bacterium]|nr:SRPBCC family protein [Betaproteobacteria bacterium]
MMRLAVRPVLFALALAILPAAAHAVAPDSRGIAVAIHRDGEAYVVDVDLTVDATPQEAWNVLTDYDHMSEFVSNLTMSHIVRRASDSLEVAQTSRVKFGLFDFKFDNVREIELVPPQEIRSKLVRGDMTMSAFTTRVAAEGNATRITNHGRFIPDRWIPPLIGTMVLEAETRKQFAELRAEILRRKDSGHTSTR